MSELPVPEDEPEVLVVAPVEAVPISLKMKLFYGLIGAGCLIGWLADPVIHADTPPPPVSTTLSPR